VEHWSLGVVWAEQRDRFNGYPVISQCNARNDLPTYLLYLLSRPGNKLLTLTFGHTNSQSPFGLRLEAEYLVTVP